MSVIFSFILLHLVKVTITRAPLLNVITHLSNEASSSSGILYGISEYLSSNNYKKENNIREIRKSARQHGNVIYLHINALSEIVAAALVVGT